MDKLGFNSTISIGLGYKIQTKMQVQMGPFSIKLFVLDKPFKSAIF